jgi:hypothetical protein
VSLGTLGRGGVSWGARGGCLGASSPKTKVCSGVGLGVEMRGWK